MHFHEWTEKFLRTVRIIAKEKPGCFGNRAISVIVYYCFIFVFRDVAAATTTSNVTCANDTENISWNIWWMLFIYQMVRHQQFTLLIKRKIK